MLRLVKATRLVSGVAKGGDEFVRVTEALHRGGNR